MDWYLKITKADNGYLIEEPMGDYTKKVVFEEVDSDRRMDECKTMQDVLYYVLNTFLPRDKHKNHNIDIRITEELE